VDKPIEPPSNPAPVRRTWPWRVLRAVGIYIGIPYLALVILAGVFQRRLIYHPTHYARALAAQSTFAPGTLFDVTTTSTDGVTLNGWHFLPAGSAAKTQADVDRQLATAPYVVIYFYGNGGSRPVNAADCRDLTNAGAHVFLFDYRGYGDNAGSPSEKLFLADARAIWNYVTTERKVPPDRVLIFGQSLGGGVATGLAAYACGEGTPPAGLVLESTFSSMADAAGWHYPFLPVSLLLVDRFPSAERAKAITCPLLLFHGTADDIVPIEFGRRLFDAFPARSQNGIPKQFVEVPGAGHNDVPAAKLQSALKAFLARLGPSKRP
jgi:uncharacterized protein